MASTRAWLNAARRVRPVTLGRAIEDLDRAEVLALSIGDGARLERIRTELVAIADAYERTDAGYEALFGVIREGDAERIMAQARALRAEEQEITRLHRRAWRSLQREMSSATARAAEREEQAAWTTAILAAVAIGLALLVIVYATYLLKPLQALQKRVLAVSRGELTPAPAPQLTRDDEIGRLAAEFERMVEALVARDATLRESERLAAIGRMAAHVTHEVRNPLSSLGLNVELLGDELPEDSAEGRRLMGAIQGEIDRLTAITEDYLRLARTPSPRFSPCDLGALLREIVEFIEPELAAANVRVSLDAPDAPLVLALDAAQLRQALVNLIRNAREAMPSGGELSLEVRAAEGHVEVDVLDEGEGVDAEAREHLFDLFYTTRERGTGLGLPLTKQIIDAHGGTLGCLLRQPQGTCFRITLPRSESV